MRPLTLKKEIKAIEKVINFLEETYLETFICNVTYNLFPRKLDYDFKKFEEYLPRLYRFIVEKGREFQGNDNYYFGMAWSNKIGCPISRETKIEVLKEFVEELKKELKK